MPVDESYRKQVALLVNIVPLVAKEVAFALKGGTALGSFLRESIQRDACSAQDSQDSNCSMLAADVDTVPRGVDGEITTASR